jgi:hypothetical protein
MEERKVPDPEYTAPDAPAAAKTTSRWIAAAILVRVLPLRLVTLCTVQLRSASVPPELDHLLSLQRRLVTFRALI